MAERAGAAVHVDLVVRQAEVAHRRHGDDGEGLVDLEEVDVVRRVQPAFSSSFLIAPTGAVVNQAGAWAMAA